MLKTKNLKDLKYRLAWLHQPYSHYDWPYNTFKKYFPKVKRTKRRLMFEYIKNDRYRKKFLILIKEVKKAPWNSSKEEYICQAIVNKELGEQAFRLNDNNYTLISLIDIILRKLNIKENEYIIKVYKRYLRRYGNKDR